MMILYQETSGRTFYAQLVGPLGTVWNGTAFVDPAVVVWGNSAIALTEAGATGFYSAAVPAGAVTAVTAAIRLRSGPSAVATDRLFDRVGLSPDKLAAQLIATSGTRIDVFGYQIAGTTPIAGRKVVLTPKVAPTADGSYTQETITVYTDRDGRWVAALPISTQWTVGIDAAGIARLITVPPDGPSVNYNTL